MTKNAYGVEFRDSGENFADWEWGDYGEQDLIHAISAGAAKTVLNVIAERSHLGLYTGPNGCFIRVALGQDMGELSVPFGALIDDWIDIYGIGEEAPPLIAALEDALARIKAVA